MQPVGQAKSRLSRCPARPRECLVANARWSVSETREEPRPGCWMMLAARKGLHHCNSQGTWAVLDTRVFWVCKIWRPKLWGGDLKVPFVFLFPPAEDCLDDGDIGNRQSVNSPQNVRKSLKHPGVASISSHRGTLNLPCDKPVWQCMSVCVCVCVCSCVCVCVSVCVTIVPGSGHFFTPLTLDHEFWSSTSLEQ